MGAAPMSLELHERGTHVVTTGGPGARGLAQFQHCQESGLVKTANRDTASLT